MTGKNPMGDGIVPVQPSDLAKALEDLSGRIAALEKAAPSDKLSMVVFSGDLDRILAAFVIATGATAMGSEVSLFFTFWGTAALRNPDGGAKGKDLISRMFGWMLPKGTKALKLSKMNMGGAGTAMMKWLMTKKNVASLEEMLELAGEFGVRIIICEMSMDLMGMKREEMIPYPHLSYGGVAKFLEEAGDSRVTLFI